MDIGSLLLLIALIVIVAVFIASPLREQKKIGGLGEYDLKLSQILAERERVLEALAELDFDYEMEKVPDDLYPIQRDALVKRGTDVLRLLDAYQENASAATDDTDHAARLERAASIRTKSDDPLEAAIAARRQKKMPIAPQPTTAKTLSKGNFCPNCGSAIQSDDRFCASCGQALTSRN